MAAPHSFVSGISIAKRALRAHALAIRATCDPALGAELARHVLAHAPPPPGAVVAGYWPIGTEIDIRPLLIALRERGHAVVLPVTPPRGSPLGFRAWWPDMAMEAEPFGTFRPTGDELVPDWLFVPLLAFDRGGGRLGYGGGYYDRTLAGLTGATAIGCGFAAQEVEAVPLEPDDMRLTSIATEKGMLSVDQPLLTPMFQT